ncbi:beta strand repeat-containing protein [Lichenicoccus sp.]|uniref:beta strand repeat-containing protein n=1 Tax=Lichenicoccus sp. TaxID=2781899 RepID=UPI003D10D7E3
MAIHDWKPDASGFILDPAEFTDGGAFTPGDTLVVGSGDPNANATNGAVGTLTTGVYLFESTAAGVGARFQDIAFDASSSLIESGAGSLQMLTFGRFVSNGNFVVGTAAGAGSTQISMDSSPSSAASFTNTGHLAVQNASTLKFYPSTASTIVNTATGIVTVSDGSQLIFSDFNGFSAGSGDGLQNDGLIQVLAGPHGGASLTVEATFGGSGTLLVQGQAGVNPTATAAHIAGPASGTFDVASGELDFSAGNPVAGTINFLDADGLLNLEQTPAGGDTTLFKPLLATVNHFQAGDQILLNGYAATQSYRYDPVAHALTLYSGASGQGTVQAELILPGLYSTSDFTITNGATTDGIAANSPGSVLIGTSSTANGTALLVPGANFVGSDGNQIITAPGNATITTGTGANTISLGAGAHLLVSNGQDSVTAGTGSDTVFGGNGGHIQAGAGTMEFIGRNGTDTVSGGAGAMTVFGAAGGGVYQAGGAGGSVLIATAGNTTLTGGANHDALFANAASGDVLQAGTQSGAGFDYLVGGAGAATLQNGQGNTVMYAGAGADSFGMSAANAGTDWVIGFKQGTDHIALGGANATNVLQGAGFSAAGTTFAVGGSQVTVWNVHLTAADFG